MHLGPAARGGRRQVPHQPAQGMVPQRRGDQDQWRLRGHLPPEAAAALPDRAARLGPVAGLSVPPLDGADAPAPDRHWTLQVRRVQAERTYQGRAQPGLLETGTAPPRWHRAYDHRQPGDLAPRFRRREARFYLLDDPALERPEEAGAAGGLRRG